MKLVLNLVLVNLATLPYDIYIVTTLGIPSDEKSFLFGNIYSCVCDTNVHVVVSTAVL